jgi:hypothetical protein
MFEELFMVLVYPRNFVNSQNGASIRFFRQRLLPTAPVEKHLLFRNDLFLPTIIFKYIIGRLGG